MAENPHLSLKIAGAKTDGESTQFTDGQIECHSFGFGISNPIDWATGAASGRRQYTSIAISKRIDKASPLLMKALVTNQIIDGVFKFFRPPADGKAVSEHFYTIEIKHGRVESVNQSGGSDLPIETVTFAYRAITCTFVKGGVTHADDWSKAK